MQVVVPKGSQTSSKALKQDLKHEHFFWYQLELYIEYGPSYNDPILGTFWKSRCLGPAILDPKTPKELQVQFLLYTRLNPFDPEYIQYYESDTSYQLSLFNACSPTIILFHGANGGIEYELNGLNPWKQVVKVIPNPLPSTLMQPPFSKFFALASLSLEQWL